MAKVKISKEKLEQLKIELEKAIEARPGIVERVATARSLGDLKENSEYHGARDEQRDNERKIEEVEAILKNYEIIDGSKMSHDVVAVGSTVKLSGDDDKAFTIVSSVESDPINGKVSDESPIGQALIGKKLGDEIEIGGKKYKIRGIA
ncbi:MAG: transcription elongation factor GreA [Patescibacteria group bacterium]|nr:transcription elongation factor GreA [Patescibacteria group bacterium]